MAKKKRVAILGGGLAGMTTAYELSKHPDYEVTVYQMGWRLGGKGASGRGPDGRIEEHGLHIWFGFYENSFRVMRECYAKLGRAAGTPMATVEDAFRPCHSVGQAVPDAKEKWVKLMMPNPVNPGAPGIGEDYPGWEAYVHAIFEFFKETCILVLKELLDPKTWLGTLPKVRKRLHDRLTGKLKNRPDVSPLDVLERIREVLTTPLDDLADDALDEILGAVRGLVRLLPSLPATKNARFMADTGGAFLVGILRDRIFSKGFDQIDNIEFSDWLLKHGLEKETLQSAFIRGTYDTVFGFRQGDPDQPILAAGTGLRSGIRMMFGYKGAFMYTMQAGMGDIVFTPLYELGKRNGVRFRFFHRVDALHLAADKKSVASVELTRQVQLHNAEYDPLVPVKGLACWPSEPRYEQIQEGAQLQQLAAQGRNVNLESFWCEWDGGSKLSLQAGVDYDELVLAIPVSSFPHICKELIDDADNKWKPGDAKSKWALMVEKIETSRTMGSQVWLDRDLAALGWPSAPPMLGAFQRPLSTYADLSHLIECEAFASDPQPRHLAYFCGPMRDDPNEPPTLPPGQVGPHGNANGGYPETQTQIVRDETLALLCNHMPAFWKKFRMQDLHCKPGSSDADRFKAQFFRANVDPSERYVLSVPGSTEARPRADESGYVNLTLAGDWTRNGLNAGCVEATIMSGLQAARALGVQGLDIVGEKDGELPLSWGLAGKP